MVGSCGDVKGQPALLTCRHRLHIQKYQVGLSSKRNNINYYWGFFCYVGVCTYIHTYSSLYPTAQDDTVKADFFFFVHTLCSDLRKQLPLFLGDATSFAHLDLGDIQPTVILSLRWAEEKRIDSLGLTFRFMLISTSNPHFLRSLRLLLGRILISPNIRSTHDLIQDLTSGGRFHLLVFFFFLKC